MDDLIGFGREYSQEELAALAGDRERIAATRSEGARVALEERLRRLESEGQRNTVSLGPLQARALIVIERLNAAGAKAYGAAIATALGDRPGVGAPYNPGQIHGVMQSLAGRGLVEPA